MGELTHCFLSPGAGPTEGAAGGGADESEGGAAGDGKVLAAGGVVAAGLAGAGFNGPLIPQEASANEETQAMMAMTERRNIQCSIKTTKRSMQSLARWETLFRC
jgi:hypothetical protein